METKIASLTTDLKKNQLHTEDLSRSYVLHERDLYNLAILALKGVESKRILKSNQSEGMDKSPSHQSEPEKEKEEKEAPPADVRGGQFTKKKMQPQTEAADKELKEELQKILKSNFFSIETKEILIHELLHKLHRDHNLGREREIVHSQSPHHKKYMKMGGGNTQKSKVELEEPKRTTQKQSWRIDNLSKKLRSAMENIKKHCQLPKQQQRHLKLVLHNIQRNFAIEKQQRLFSTDLQFFFQDNHIVSGTIRFPLPKLLAVFSLQRSQLFDFLSKRGKISKFTSREKRFLRRFSQMSNIKTDLLQ